jgi:hypothetical protein
MHTYKRFYIHHDRNLTINETIDDIVNPEPALTRAVTWKYEDLVKLKSCPKCDQAIRLDITKTTFHCRACGFIAYAAYEEKPLTMEMIQRPAPSNGWR